jgi:hypothetical protein
VVKRSRHELASLVELLMSASDRGSRKRFRPSRVESGSPDRKAPFFGQHPRFDGISRLLLRSVAAAWASGAVGSAPEWHSGGQGFESPLVHQTFLSRLDFPQVAEDWCGCAGSNKAISVERDSVGKEQLLEPLSLIE